VSLIPFNKVVTSLFNCFLTFNLFEGGSMCAVFDVSVFDHGDLNGNADVYQS